MLPDPPGDGGILSVLLPPCLYTFQVSSIRIIAIIYSQCNRETIEIYVVRLKIRSSFKHVFM